MQKEKITRNGEDMFISRRKDREVTKNSTPHRSTYFRTVWLITQVGGFGPTPLCTSRTQATTGKFSRCERSVLEERSVDGSNKKNRNPGCRTPSRELGKAEKVTQAVGTGLLTRDPT